MNLDGATDYPDYRFDRDDRSRMTFHDDRDPFVNFTGNKYGPPSVPSSRSPYAQTVRGREQTATQHRHGSSYGQELSPFPSKEASKRAYSRYSEPVSPGTRLQHDIPAPGFQYGSGPLPSQSRAETHRRLMDEVLSSETSKNAPVVDPALLEKIVTDAVKRGVEESRKKDAPERDQKDVERYEHDAEDSSQVPGAWPVSPTRPASRRSKRYNRHHDTDDVLTWDQHSKTSKQDSTRNKVETHVAWDEELGWDKQSKVDNWSTQSKMDGWSSPDDKPSDSWGTEETWSTKKPGEWEEVRRKSRSLIRTVRSPSPSRRVSHASGRTSDRRHSKHSRSHRSQWIEDPRSSSDDNDGWTHIEAPSDSTTSLGRSDSTLKPSHSRSQIQPLRNRSTRRTSRQETHRTDHEQRASQRVETPKWQTKSVHPGSVHTPNMHPQSAHHDSSPSVLVTNAPSVMSTPISNHPVDVRSRKLSAYSIPPASLVAPPPTWGCAGSEKTRKKSVATTYLPPAPFSVIGEDRRESRQSSGESSWGVASNNASESKSNEKGSVQQSTWGEDKLSDKAKSTWGDADKKATDWNANQTSGWEVSSTEKQSNSGWNDVEKDKEGWDITNNTKGLVVDGWNTSSSSDNWVQDDKKDAVADGWDTESKENDWDKNKTSKDGGNNAGAFDGWNDNQNTWGTGKDADAPSDQQKPTPNDISLNKDAGDLCTAAAALVADEKAKPPPQPKRHTSKSLSKYRQLSAPILTPKAHWQFPPPPSKKTLRPSTEDQASLKSGRTKRIPSVPSEPLRKIPKAAAEEKGIEHQVLAGPGTQYGHAIGRPEYIDRLDKPYAVFRFKYRSRSILKSMFGADCLNKTGTMKPPVGKEDLKALPQEELIKKMLALQTKLAEKEGGEKGKADVVSQCTESVAKDLTEKWVSKHSRDTSEQGKAKASSAKAESAKKVDAWNAGLEELVGVKW